MTYKANAPVPCPLLEEKLKLESMSETPGESSRQTVGPVDVPCEWLDSMRSSSPPRRLSSNDFSFEMAKLDGVDATPHHSWMLKHPSALTSFKHIADCAKGKQIALFLDYDGTLSPIVNDPDLAFMSDAMRDVVSEVGRCFPTAIISGRCRDKVFEFVGLTELYYAGSHGMDIMCPAKPCSFLHDQFTDNMGKGITLFQPAREFLPMMEEVFKALIESTRTIEGVKVENNTFCVSVHYRLVEIEKWAKVAQCVGDVVNHYPRLRVSYGRKVLEVRPVINWDKGRAVEFLVDSLGLGSYKNVFPIYIGDDTTDEDAFKFLCEHGQGCGILVTSAPKETNAFYSLRDPDEVMDFLKNLLSCTKG